MQWHNEVRDMRELKPHPRNPRLATDRGMAALEKSIERNGDFDTIAINLDGTVLSGHRRRDLYLKRGEFEKEVRVPERMLTEEEAEAVLIEANKAIAGEWDFEILANDFEIEELMDYGFTDADLHIDSGDPSGKEYDESVADGVARETAYKVRVPIMDADNFEQDLTEVLRKYPKARMEKNV